MHDELVANGYQLREYSRVGIAPTIGHCVDLGASALLRAKLEGRDFPFLGAVEMAIAEFGRTIAGGCDYDAVTRNPNDAEIQIRRMLLVYHEQVLPGLKPQSIQRELTATLSGGFILIGHWDCRDTEKLLHDLKTGHSRWPVTPQLGLYVILGAANKLPIDAAVVDYIERVAVNKPQPGAIKFYYQAELLKRHAIAVVNRVRRDILAVRAGDLDSVPANPFSQFCSRRFCPAHGIKGEKVFCDWWQD
jgi:hypothetical protein